jgi:toxin ParE1/3/4
LGSRFGPSEETIVSLPVILIPKAEQDIEAASAWYDAQRIGLGQDFLDRANDALNRIRTMPELYAPAWQDIRLCPLKRFPFIVYYRVLVDRIEVIAVFHGSRDPSAWQSRA